MNKFVYLALGCLLGGVGGHFWGPEEAPRVRQVAQQAAAGPGGESPTTPATSGRLLPAPVPVPVPGPAAPVPQQDRPLGVSGTNAARPLIDKLAAETDNAIGSESYKDLACLMRRDHTAVAQVRARLLEGIFPNERHALVRLLATDSSPQTGELLVELINSQDRTRRRLGLDLLQASSTQNGSGAVTRALVQASLVETDREYLSDILAKLTEQRLDPSSAAAVTARMQSLMSSPNGDLRAQALGVLARQMEPTTLAMAVKRSLYDPDADVRVSATSAALRLPLEQLDHEMVSAMARLSQSATEPEAVRQLAAGVLARRSQP